MSIYAYTNPYNSITQINSTLIPFGAFAGKYFDAIIEGGKKGKKESGHFTESCGETFLFEGTKNGDIVITSTLANFSTDLYLALQDVNDLYKKGVRVIATQEDFDTVNINAQALLASLPMMKTFYKNAFKAKKATLMAGIQKAKDEGKYKGRKALSPADFPQFGNLFTKYMRREIGKSEFAEKLNVSRPTLDKLLEDFTKKKGE